MRAITLLLTFTISLITYSQQGMIQELEMSKKDSIRLRQVPELKVKPNFFQNKAPLPTSVDNSIHPYWRGIFWQGGCSCGQASSEGYVFTYEIDRKRDLDASLDENRYAYSFTYNFLHVGCGASWLESQDIIREAGIPNVVTNGGVMGDPGLKLWLSGYDKYYSAMQNRINNVYGISIGTPEGLNVLKNWLHNHLEDSPYGGLAFFYANHVYIPEVLPEGTPEAGKHIITSFVNTSHSMTIVGYNDEVRYDYNNDGQYTNNIDITGDGIVDMRDWEIGALKIANSYNGSSSPLEWADEGFCYVMYRVLPYHNSQGGFWDKRAYVSDVKESYQPLLTAKVNLTYDSRDKIKVMAGVSTDLSASFPDYVEDFPHFRFQGGDEYMQGGDEEADKTIEFGLDLSELLNYVDANQPAKYFLYIKENDVDDIGQGQVNSFSIIDYTNGGAEYISSQTNVPITDNGNTLLSVEANVSHSELNIVTDTIPKVEFNNPYSTQVQAQGGSEPYRWFPFYDYKITSAPNTFEPITGSTVPDVYNNIQLDFDFPFYGKTYNSGTVSEYGALMFEFEDANVPYHRDYSILMRYFKSIAPFYGASSSETIRYEGDETYAKIYWTATFEEQELEYMITLFPDGTIYIDYGNGTTPNNPEWQAGVTKGDQISYQEFDFSGQSFPANTRFILEPRPFPAGLDIGDDGVITGTISEEFVGDSIFVKVVDNNWLSEVKGFAFIDRGMLFSDYIVETPNDSILEYGETAQLSLTISNVGTASINNINLKLHAYSEGYTLVDSLEFLSTLNASEAHTLNQAFEFEVDEQIADNTVLNLVISVEADELSAYDTISFVARAPLLHIINTEFVDTNDHILDPGETGDLLITYKNIGGSGATNLLATYTSDDNYLTINSVSNDTKAELLPDSTWVTTLNITADSLTPEGYVGYLNSGIDADKSFHADHSVLVGVGLTVENWESGTIETFPWGVSGNADWYIDTVAHEGNYALHSGDITDGEASTLTLVGTVASSGNLSFYKKVSSENNYDFLRFYIDSVKVAEWSGEQDWTEHTFVINSGFHSFQWKYEKDGTVSNGEDAAWIDYIVFPAVDFSLPEMQVSDIGVEKWMDTNSLGTDTIVVTNIGGGLLTYAVSIDSATLSTPIPVANVGQTKSIEGSAITVNPETFNVGMPFHTELTVTNASTDSEWIKNVTVSFPLGVTLDSATSFVGGSAGNLDWDGTYGDGSDVSWFGENEDGWGVIKGGESATATLYLRIDEAITNNVTLPCKIDGDAYGEDPHSIMNYLTLTNQGLNTTWLTLGNENGNLIADENANVLLNFNSYGIPPGTYNCVVSIESEMGDSVGVPITLHIIEGLGVPELSSSVKLYPNPTKNYFIVEADLVKESKIKVYDAIGHIVYHQSFYKKALINTKGWASGIYFVEIEDLRAKPYKLVVQ